MDNKKTILSICIPTYNRKKRISEQVKALLPQIDYNIELIVIDNCSEYNIYDCFSEEELSRFRIIRNKFNIGADANIAKCFEVCNSDWLWTLSDDDIIRDDTIVTVLNILQRYESSIFVNFNHDKTFDVTGLSEFSQKGLANYSNLFWMSTCLYNLDLLRKYISHYYKAISSMQPGVVLLVKALEDANYTISFNNYQIVTYGHKSISWDREDFFYSTLILFDKFRKMNRPCKDRFFDSIQEMCFMNIALSIKTGKSFGIAMKMLSDLCLRRGIFSTLFHKGLSLSKCFILIFVYNFRYKR